MALGKRGGNSVVLSLGLWMAQMVWYFLALILFPRLGVAISYLPCIWRRKGTMVNWKVFVITSCGFLDYVMSIFTFLGNLLSHMGMFHGF